MFLRILGLTLIIAPIAAMYGVIAYISGWRTMLTVLTISLIVPAIMALGAILLLKS